MLGLSCTRYADDLAFSGDRVNVIILEEGFLINPKNMRVMTSSQRLAGVIVNERSNVSRADFDLLKAILHRGSASEEREHLRGRIAAVQMLNAKRAEKLLRKFEPENWK